jgi:hypothetical protein
MPSRTGRCLCGAVTYEITGDPIVTAVCHCTHCQKQSGAMFSTNIMVQQAQFHQTGETRTYEDFGDSGKKVLRNFCPKCGSPITSAIEAMPGMVAVKAGTLDNFKDVQPAIEVYTDHAADFVPRVPGIPSFGQGAG